MTQPGPRSWRGAALALFVVAWGANMFAPLLQVYRRELSAVEVTSLFGAYALGLVPALLLLGPVSDRWGRRAVVLPALLLAVVGSGVLLAAGSSFIGLLTGRIVVGISAGAAFGPATAWLKELTDRGGSAASGATRATVALSSGFALAPFAAGAIAQWLSAPDVTPYVVHLVIMAVALPFVWRTPETRTVTDVEPTTAPSNVSAVLRGRIFLMVVLPTAPWVFGAATTAFAVLPSMVSLGDFSVVGAGVAAALTLGTGVLVQPWARSLARRSPALPFRFGVLAVTIGMLVSALTAHTHLAALIVPAALLLGSAYGLLLVSGLNAVADLASPGALGTLTGAFYVLTYTGFAFPLVVAALAPALSAPVVLTAAAAIAAASSIGTLTAWRERRRPRQPADAPQPCVAER